MQPVYIDVHMDNIVKILAYYGEPNPAIFIYTDYLAAVGIQHLLKMKETNKTCYFDPISKGKFFCSNVQFFGVLSLHHRVNIDKNMDVTPHVVI